MTERLYWRDAGLFEFEARVEAQASWRERPSVVLNRTAFYPEAGGQNADHGQLAGLRVGDVQVDERGRIHHLVEGELPEVGALITGQVDAKRRREHMALHTGQHLLSHAILDAAKAHTVSSRLGERVSTLDVSVAELSRDAIDEAVARVNDLIDEDRPVRTSFPSPERLATLPLRRTPKVKDGIRVVEVEGFDVTPCGGTHAKHTSQVQGLFVLSHGRYKGGTRLTFLAGPRLRRVLVERATALDALATRFTCAPEDVDKAVENLGAELKRTRTSLGAARLGLAGGYAETLASQAVDGRLTAVLDVSMDEARVISRKLVAREMTVLLACDAGDRLSVLVSRPEAAGPDLGAFLHESAKALGGGGGGRPQYAEGSLPRAAWGELETRFRAR